MRGSALAVTVLALSCSKPRGALVGFQGSLGATDIEVFVGDTAVTSQSSPRCLNDGQCGITPPPNGLGKFADYAAEGWTSALGSATHAELDDQLVGWVELEPADGVAAAPAMIAVQYNGTTITRAAVIDDLALRRGDTVEVAMDLAATIDAGDGTPPPVGQLPLQVWRRVGDDAARARSACALVQRADGSHEFITPADDPDCDGATECSPRSTWDYCQQPAAALAQDATCVTQTPSHACRFGAMACADVGGACPQAGSATGGGPLACAPTQDVACMTPDVCSDAQCTSWQACTAQAQALSRIECNISVQLVDKGSAGNEVVPCGAPAIDSGSDATITPLLGGLACQGMFLMPKQDQVEIDGQIALSTPGMTATLVASAGGGGSGLATCPAVLQIGGVVASSIASSVDDLVTFGFAVPGALRLVPLEIATTTVTDCNSGGPSTCRGTESGDFVYPCP